ncbi:MAG: 16S rRNA (cytidine(1402)-2'-O)-methyltransferase [Acidobacteria bacterium RIFCSPLOWO2_12_FULL_60_22]|nr:MAG: 16S rRNA (cytidine(1402)-2'-O)-methyltransferase [Acidobacteria bacterium RIFCSPLOWO2_12_FULL_60_22]
MKAKSIAEVRGFPETGQGILYLVGTPIGNLEDITLRALRVLRQVDLIACEDTRQTQKLMNHFRIETQTTSYHEHNEMTKAPELVMRMEEGARIALVSDAGMPGISDPGYRLVHLCIRHKIAVAPVPGPSAVVAALSVSGLSTHAFQFFGFLPARKIARRKFLKTLADLASTTVVFESPRRLLDALQDLLSVLGDRPVVVARELTKLHEEFLRGRCSEVLEELRKRPAIQGEVTLLIGPVGEEPPAAAHAQPLRERVQELIRGKKLSRMEALKTVARERHISKSQAYREYES